MESKNSCIKWVAITEYRICSLLPLARVLGGVPLTSMERYARRRTPEHEQVIEKIKARYW